MRSILCPKPPSLRRELAQRLGGEEVVKRPLGTHCEFAVGHTAELAYLTSCPKHPDAFAPLVTSQTPPQHPDDRLQAACK